MARVYRRDRKWYMDARHPQTGKRIRKVIPAETKREAERVLHAIQRKWELGEALPGERETVTFRALAGEFWKTCVEGGSNRRGRPHKASTVASERFRVDALKDHFGDRAVDGIEGWEYAAFLDGLLKKGRSVATRNRYLAALAPMLNLAHQRGWVSRVPVLPPMRKEPRRVETVLSDDDLAKLLGDCESTPGLSERVRFLFLTGMRLSEVFPDADNGRPGLQWQDVDMESGVIVLRNTKGGGDDIVRLHPLAQDLLRSQYARAAESTLKRGSGSHKGNAPVWQGHALDRPQNLRRAFKRTLEAAGLDTRYRLHDLRAQFAVALLTQGADIETVREAMRHSTIVTTARYLRLTEGRVAEAVRGLRLPAVNE